MDTLPARACGSSHLWMVAHTGRRPAGNHSRLAASLVTVLGAPQGPIRADNSWLPGCGQTGPGSAVQGTLGPPSPCQVSKVLLQPCSNNCILKII